MVLRSAARPSHNWIRHGGQPATTEAKHAIVLEWRTGMACEYCSSACGIAISSKQAAASSHPLLSYPAHTLLAFSRYEASYTMPFRSPQLSSLTIACIRAHHRAVPIQSTKLPVSNRTTSSRPSPQQSCLAPDSTDLLHDGDGIVSEAERVDRNRSFPQQAFAILSV